MDTPTNIQVKEMHALYIHLTGIEVSLAGREWTWWEWLKRGLTAEDLRALVREKKARIRAGELPRQSLAFRNLVGNVDYAEEDAKMLRALARAPRMDSGRAAALKATGRPPEPERPAERRAGAVAEKLVSDPAAAERAFEEFKKLKQNL